jgi:capsule polysaccharide export protein KpsE/RkpR
MKTTPNSEYEVVDQPDVEGTPAEGVDEKAAREKRVALLRLLWEQRRFLLRVTGYGLLVSAVIAFLIPKRFESSAQLMPPDAQSTSGLAMLASLTSRTGGLGTLATDLLGVKSTSALFVGILRSRTVEDRLIQQFDLKNVYWSSRIEDAREDLESHTKISEDRKNGIITIKVTDKDPQRATAIAQAYVKELDRLVAEVSTSAARRERVFLEGRLKAVKEELDQASREFSQFASKNTTIDIKEQGRAMVEAAATLAGHLIAAQTELEGLRQIYSDNNVRVRASQARIAELKRQLKKLGGDAPDAPPDPANGEESMYPSIRKLPLLGVTYFDLFRRTKINEVIFELLTQQYELAKVQEAKEIPTVKVLDEPVVPEKKSFPPRLLIIFLGTSLSFAAAVAWVLGSARWNETADEDSRKEFVREVWTSLSVQRHWISQNGSRFHAVVGRLGKLFHRKQVPPPTGKDTSSNGDSDAHVG